MFLRAKWLWKHCTNYTKIHMNRNFMGGSRTSQYVFCVPWLTHFIHVYIFLSYTLSMPDCSEVMSNFCSLQSLHFLRIKRNAVALLFATIVSWATHLPEFPFGSGTHSHLTVTCKHTRIVWNHVRRNCTLTQHILKWSKAFAMVVSIGKNCILQAGKIWLLWSCKR